MAPVRITPAILLIIAIFYTWSSLKDHVHFFFVPLLFGLLTSNYVTGTNLEIVYIPFILGTLVFGLREHVFLAALSAAIAVSIKYTCALDLLGVACFLFLYKGKTKTIVKAFALSMALFLVIHVPIYWYFHNLGVDVIYESIIRNMVHSGDHQSFEIPRYLPFFFGGLLVLILWRIPLRRSDSGFRVRLGLTLWTALSLLQSQLTGKQYYHYFIPVFLPMTLLATHVMKDRFKGLCCALVIVSCLCITVGAGGLWYRYYALNITYSERLSGYCDEGDFHYHGKGLIIYRYCNVRPLTYMFPPFYSHENFSKVADSGGLRWLDTVDRKVIYDDQKSVTVFDDGQKFRAFLEQQ